MIQHNWADQENENIPHFSEFLETMIKKRLIVAPNHLHTLQSYFTTLHVQTTTLFVTISVCRSSWAILTITFEKQSLQLPEKLLLHSGKHVIEFYKTTKIQKNKKKNFYPVVYRFIFLSCSAIFKTENFTSGINTVLLCPLVTGQVLLTTCSFFKFSFQ